MIDFIFYYITSTSQIHLTYWDNEFEVFLSNKVSRYLIAYSNHLRV